MEQQPVLDFYAVKETLNKLELDLLDPVLQRRARMSSNRENILEELTDTVEELIKKQRELQATIKISKELIDENEFLQKEVYDLKEQLGKNISEREKLKKKLREMKVSLSGLKKDINHSQEIAEELSDQNKILILETVKLREIPQIQKKQFKQFQTELQERNIELSQQLEYFSKAFCETKQFLKSQVVEKNSVLEKQKQIMKRIEGLEKQKTRFMKKLNQYQTQKLAFQQKIFDLENDNQQYREDNQFLSVTNRELEKRYQTLKQVKMNEKYSRKSSFQENQQDFPIESLEQELNCLQNEQLLFLNNNHSFYKKTIINLDIQSGVQIFIKSSQKSFKQDYFNLNAHSIIKNSQYLKNSFSAFIPTLFQKAIKHEVPIHKWYLWLEKELNTLYVKSL